MIFFLGLYPNLYPMNIHESFENVSNFNPEKLGYTLVRILGMWPPSNDPAYLVITMLELMRNIFLFYLGFNVFFLAIYLKYKKIDKIKIISISAIFLALILIYYFNVRVSNIDEYFHTYNP